MILEDSYEIVSWDLRTILTRHDARGELATAALHLFHSEKWIVKQSNNRTEAINLRANSIEFHMGDDVYLPINGRKASVDRVKAPIGRHSAPRSRCWRARSVGDAEVDDDRLIEKETITHCRDTIGIWRVWTCSPRRAWRSISIRATLRVKWTDSTDPAAPIGRHHSLVCPYVSHGSTAVSPILKRSGGTGANIQYAIRTRTRKETTETAELEWFIDVS